MSVDVNIKPPSLNVQIGSDQLGIGTGSPVARYVIEPYMTVEEVADGVVITCTAQGQTTTGEVYNGQDGADGKDGKDGKDGQDGATGRTPEIFTRAVGLAAGATPYADTTGTIEQPLITFGIPAGQAGADGQDGKDGKDGQDGADGVSPEVTVASITGGHSVTITDADHPGGQTFNVMDGQDGAQGNPTEVNGKTGASITLTAADVGALPDSIDVDEVKQNYPADPTQYSYWRPLAVGQSSNQSESGAFAEQTGKLYTFDAIRVQPSTGTVKATKFKGNLTGNVTGNVTGDVTGTASGNYVLPQNGIPATDLAGTYAGADTDGGSAIRANGILYGAVDDTSTATAFTATITGVTAYYHGLQIMLKNGVITSAAGFTININGLGAKPVYTNMAAATAESTKFNVNYTLLFVYDEDRVTGGCWMLYNGYDSNTNTIGYQIRTNNCVLPVKTYCGRYRLLFKSPNGEHYVPANADSQTSAAKSHTPTTEKIDPFAGIRYYATTTILSANATVGAGAVWQQYNLSLGYSFNNSNAALTLTTSKPVYIKCTPNTDGSANIYAAEPYVQALPTTNDGYIYIYVGIASAATTVELDINNPVYYHNGTGIRIWTGG